ncbi:hypothetical protein ACU635_50710 [[Actinomadura] parvosata]|uniref:hypothetical protein n=1 Tax=[Actinomadura] parvosata TaxID=1955412 RepID=UPI00406D1723
MPTYADRISQITGHTDPATLALIEQVMRVHLLTATLPALDQLTDDDFTYLARHALADIENLHTMGVLEVYCWSFGLDVPDWAALAGTAAG